MIKNEYKSVLIPFFIALLTLLTRLPFRSKSLFNWDSVNFALGILDFNIIQHRPHPPGYILYIKLAQIINGWFHDPNLALVWISIVCGTLAVIMVYFFTKHRFGTSDALIAALLTLSNPLLWFYDELALTYSLEAFLTIAIAYSCYRTIDGSRIWPYIGALFLGISGGFRQTTLIIMLPVAIYSALFLPWKKRCFLVLISGSICTTWGIALISSTGGLKNYLIASRQLSLTLDPESFVTILRSLFYGGHIPLLFALAAITGIYRLPENTLRTWERTFLFLWLAPGLLVISFGHLGQSGYMLFVLLPLFVYTPTLMKAAFLELDNHLPHRNGTKQLSINSRVYSLLGIILVVNILAFLIGGFFLIRLQNDRWNSVEEITKEYSPSETIVISGLDRVAGFRHASYYLSNYRVYGFLDMELKGPFYFNEFTTATPGWIFQSYQLQDNYDLNPVSHQIHTILNFPEETKGLIVTNQTLWEKIVYISNGNPSKPELIPIGDWFMYVKLPEGASQLITCQERLEIR